MLVLQSNVLLNHYDTRRPPVFRNRCACHMHLHSLGYLGRSSSRKYYQWAGPVRTARPHLQSEACPVSLPRAGISVADFRTESELLDLRSL